MVGRQGQESEKGERLAKPHPTGGYDLIVDTGRAEMIYRRGGKLHRQDGPAVVWADGTQLHYLNGKLDREGGLPTVIHPDGSTETHKAGVLISTSPAPGTQTETPPRIDEGGPAQTGEPELERAG